MTETVVDNNTIIVAIISTCSAVVVALVSSLITYLVAKYNFNTPKTRNILEDQYSKLIVPLHQLIYIDGGTIQYKITISEQIVSSKYEYTPLKLVEHLKNLIDNPNEVSFNDYAQYIHEIFLLSRKKLGYDFNSNPQDTTLKPRFTDETDGNPGGSPPGGIMVHSKSNAVLASENSRLKRRVRDLESALRRTSKNTPIAHEENPGVRGAQG